MIWDLNTNQSVASFGPFQSVVNSLAVHNNVIVSGFLSGHIRVIKPRSAITSNIMHHGSYFVYGKDLVIEVG